MVFELTDALTSKIIYAMENQCEKFMLDAKDSSLVPFDEALVDQNQFYILPSWNSEDGYNLLEAFVAEFKGIKPHNELKKILAEGRGIFRKFKNILKKYPEIEVKFNLFKNRKMNLHIMDWYNALRESWGLEKLEQDFDEYDELVQEDFTFKPYNYKPDYGCIKSALSSFPEELKEHFDGDKSSVLLQMYRNELKKTFPKNKKRIEGIVCRTFTDEFAGCILYSLLQFGDKPQKKAVILNSLFVNRNYRGLGIARELFNRCISGLSESEVKFFIIPNSLVPDGFERFLFQSGFERAAFAFVLTLR